MIFQQNPNFQIFLFSFSSDCKNSLLPPKAKKNQKYKKSTKLTQKRSALSRITKRYFYWRSFFLSFCTSSFGFKCNMFSGV